MATQVILTVTGTAPEAQVFTFTSPVKVVIGRSSDCSLRLAGDLTISRRHCLGGIDAEGPWVEDLHSRNGTLVNGYLIGRRLRDDEEGPPRPRPPRPLEDGDELSVGTCTLHVHTIDADGVEVEGEVGPGHAEPELCGASA